MQKSSSFLAISIIICSLLFISSFIFNNKIRIQSQTSQGGAGGGSSQQSSANQGGAGGGSSQQSSANQGGTGGGSSQPPAQDSGGGSSQPPAQDSGGGSSQPPAQDSNEMTDAEVVEKILQKMLEFLGPFIKGIIIERILGVAISRTIEVAASFIPKYDPVHALSHELNKSKVLNESLKPAREATLLRKNVKFRVIRMLRSMNITQLRRLGTNITKSLQKLLKTDNALAQRLIADASESAARTAGPELAARLATRFSRLAALGSVAGPVDAAFLAVAAIGMGLDMSNSGNLQNISYQKTSDFLKYREDGINDSKAENVRIYTNEFSSPPPNDLNLDFNVVGPLLKFSEETMDILLKDTVTRLLLLSGDNSRYTTIEAQIVATLGGESSDQIRKIRSFQNKILTHFYRSVECLPKTGCTPLSSCTPGSGVFSPIPTGCLFKLFGVSIASQLSDDDKIDIHNIAYEYLCKNQNGKYINSNGGMCSYKTEGDCLGSYTWPLPIESELPNDVLFKTTTGLGNISCIVCKNKISYIVDKQNNKILKYIHSSGAFSTWAYSSSAPVIINLNTPTFIAFSPNEVDLFISQTNKISKIENFESSPIVTENWVTFTGSPNSIVVCGVFMYVAFNNKISRININTSTLLDNFASSFTGARFNINFGNISCIDNSSDNSTLYIVDSQNRKISKIGPLLGSTVVTDNWASSTGVVNIGSINPKSIFIVQNRTGKDDMYVGHSKAIIKIQNIDGSPLIDSNFITSTSNSNSTTKYVIPQDPIASEVNAIGRINQNLLFSDNNRIISVLNILPWDKFSGGENPPDDPGDTVYAEWRNNYDNLNRDIGKNNDILALKNDPTANGGVCVAWDPGHRMMCNSLTKLNAAKNEIGTNTYNTLTGECTNDRSFCDAYGYRWTSHMNPSDMANRGSGPLPSCYQSQADKAATYIFGETLVQGFNIFVAAAPRMFAKLGNDILRGVNGQGGLIGFTSVTFGAGATWVASEAVQAGRLRCTGDVYTQYNSGVCYHKNVDLNKLSFLKSYGRCPVGYVDDGLFCTRDLDCDTFWRDGTGLVTRCTASDTVVKGSFCPDGYEEGGLFCYAKSISTLK